MNEIVELIQITSPKSVLDVGTGFGKYGFLTREYLEVWDGRGKYGEWKRTIDGIEAFEGYLTPVHKYVYNDVYIGDALDVVPRLKRRYDLALLIDCLEHFDYEDGMRLLGMLRKTASNIIISVPKDIGEQGDVFGNRYETHRFQWERRHLKGLWGAGVEGETGGTGGAGGTVMMSNEYSLICFAGADALRVKRELRVSKLRRRVRKLFPRWCFPFLRAPYRIIRGLATRGAGR